MASDRIVVYTHLIRKPLKLYESSGFLTSFLGSITPTVWPACRINSYYKKVSKC